VALLQLLADEGPARGILPVVGHVDHGIQSGSAAIASLVGRHAERLGLPMLQARLDLGPGTTETTARALRYGALERLRAEANACGIMTAHHADDQVETVLLRLLRGSGPAGLAAMAARTVSVVRPLLHASRSDLEAFVASSGLEVWEDPTNRDPVHLRNWVRGVVLPLLRDRLPDIDARLADVARHAADQRSAWDALLDRLPGLDLQADGSVSIATVPWLGTDAPLARQLLMALGRRAGCRVSVEGAARALALVQSGVSGRRAELGDGWSASLSFGRLFLVRDAEGAPAPAVLEGTMGRVDWNAWEVSWRQGVAEPLDRRGFVTWITEGPLAVAASEPGERLVPLGFSGRRPLARLFQDARVPAVERDRWPVLRRDGQAVWVPGVCRGADAVPLPGAVAIEVTVQRVAARPGPTYASST
jgi:tRNA(Ile)-lysidine synthase